MRTLIAIFLTISFSANASCLDKAKKHQKEYPPAAYIYVPVLGSYIFPGIGLSIAGVLTSTAGSGVLAAVATPLAVGGATYLTIKEINSKRGIKILEQARSCEGKLIRKTYDRLVEEADMRLSQQELCEKIVELDENEDLCQYHQYLSPKRIRTVLKKYL